MRPIVAYDDINPGPQTSLHSPSNIPYTSPTAAYTNLNGNSHTNTNAQAQAAGTKRKRQTPHAQTRSRRPPPQNIQHWDDPGKNQDMLVYDEGSVVEMAMELAEEERELEEEEEEEEEEMSRELTHEEIWDDSALIDAWNAANEEYEAMHGRGKKWKRERKHQSPLWYNVPPKKTEQKQNGLQSKSKSKSNTQNQKQQADELEEPDSKPIDFNSFVPSHDPSLAASAGPIPGPPGMEYFSQMLSGPAHGNGNVSADEAFGQAVNAMYWVGYWTAVYHAARRSEGVEEGDGDVDGEEEEEEDIADAVPGDVDVDGSEDGLVSTQRV